MMIWMDEFSNRLRAIYCPEKNVNGSRSLKKPSLREATGHGVASLVQINETINGERDQEKLFRTYVELYGGEELIPLGILLALYPEYSKPEE